MCGIMCGIKLFVFTVYSAWLVTLGYRFGSSHCDELVELNQLVKDVIQKEK